MNDSPEFIYIYRSGKNARNVALYRENDWLTGLSFRTVAFKTNVKFNVNKLREAGYIVRFDGGELIYKLFSDDPFITDGQHRRFGANHVSVYLPEQSEWDAWYEAERQITNEDVSPQTQAFFELREKD